MTAAAAAELFGVYNEPSSEVTPRPEDFEPPGGIFLVAYAAGEAVGCGGLKRLSDELVELKRMYVVPAARGAGVGRVLLAGLEEQARARACAAVRLETGNLQLAALALYRSAGYVEIPCWGAFASDPKSICLEKRF